MFKWKTINGKCVVPKKINYQDSLVSGIGLDELCQGKSSLFDHKTFVPINSLIQLLEVITFGCGPLLANFSGLENAGRLKCYVWIMTWPTLSNINWMLTPSSDVWTVWDNMMTCWYTRYCVQSDKWNTPLQFAQCREHAEDQTIEVVFWNDNRIIACWNIPLIEVGQWVGEGPDTNTKILTPANTEDWQQRQDAMRRHFMGDNLSRGRI